MIKQRRSIKMRQPSSLPFFMYFMFQAVPETGNSSSGNQQPPF
jgi:hypothetical protein